MAVAPLLYICILDPLGASYPLLLLLRAAHGVAAGRIELTHTVVSAAQQMVAKDLIEASDDLADALGL